MLNAQFSCSLRSRLFAMVALVASPLAFIAQQPQPPIPVGLDAYRQWDRWPAQRIGMRTFMRSTFDREGGNHGVDASHFLYQLSDSASMALDLESPGVLVFQRFNHWHGSPWLYAVDGKTFILQETTTPTPLFNPNIHTPPDKDVFLPTAPFPAPLNETWPSTQGADLLWTPIAFTRSLQLAYGHTKYGTGYFIYDQFVPGTPLSTPLHTWTESEKPSSDALDLFRRAGTDIAPPANAPGAHETSGTLTVPANGPITVAKLTGKSTLRRVAFSIPKDQADNFEHIRLRITWDDRSQPSVDVPIALFFGAGALFNREDREYLVKSIPVSVRYAKKGPEANRIELACYFPMPFFRSAHIELVAPDAPPPPDPAPTPDPAQASNPIPDVHWSLRTMALTEAPNHLAYFHATYADHPRPVPGKDMTLLDTRDLEGSPIWTGSFIGTSFIFSHAGNLNTLEGDPRFFFDDSQTPQAQGTGTEEWGGGGDYWEGGRQTTLPLLGHPTGLPAKADSLGPDDKIESTYRFLLADLFPFGNRAVIHFEHGGTNTNNEHYETIAYWYGLPAASLVQTDHLQIGDLSSGPASEPSHHYVSPTATAPYTFSSRFELGIDHLPGGAHSEVFPETTDTGRTTSGTTEFNVNIRPDNLGVLLRRKLDFQYPDQRAEVYVQPVSSARGKPAAWKPAGVWYLSGSNTVVYSNPKLEHDLAEHVPETSNRRFREDEFLIPLALTQGQRSLRIRLRFTPLNRPLYPGYTVAPQAWSEINYTAYSFIEPDFRP